AARTDSPATKGIRLETGSAPRDLDLLDHLGRVESAEESVGPRRLELLSVHPPTVHVRRGEGARTARHGDIVKRRAVELPPQRRADASADPLGLELEVADIDCPAMRQVPDAAD